MDLSWLSAILVGAGCLALGYCIGVRFPAPIFISARLAKGRALVSSGNKKTKDPLEIEKLADLLDDFKMVLNFSFFFTLTVFNGLKDASFFTFSSSFPFRFWL